MSPVVFKAAESASELEQINLLNHRVFAEEIAQHPTHPSGILIDRFHASNRYFIAVRDGTVIGMISAHAGPQFSVTRRLPDPLLLRQFPRPIEVRLLAIDPAERNRTILAGLLWQVYDHAVSSGFSHILISALDVREPMYAKLGFVPLGPPVPEGAARFLPMVMSLADQQRRNGRRVRLHQRHWQAAAPAARSSPPISLMPGPVAIHPLVAQAFASPPVSHRSPAFVDTFERVRTRLNALIPGLEATIFPGAGTLANDAVAANLKAIFGQQQGLILSNGEFGERIARQADGAGLCFRQLDFGWGNPWSAAEIANALDRRPLWVWAVHLETSTGVLNDIESLLARAHTTGSQVALDCVSSLGAAPIPGHIDSLLMASGVSGKSLGSFAGLAFVYLSQRCRQLLAGKTLCPSFNILRMTEMRGPASTVPSPALLALSCALDLHYDSPQAIAGRLEAYPRLGHAVRQHLRQSGLAPIAPESGAAPNITSFVLPDPEFPASCLQAGFRIAHESAYLEARGWGQIATMGDIAASSLTPLFEAFAARI